MVIDTPFTRGTVQLDVVAKQAEAVFGIKASKLSDANVSNAFSLFFATGFNNVYGITSKNYSSNPSQTINTMYLSEINEFLMAETTSKKKALFLLHGKTFVTRYLESHTKGKINLVAYQPILDYVAQQFHLASYGLLFDGHKQTLHGEKRERRLALLKILKGYISNLLFIAMEIERINTEPTTESLKEVLKYTDAFIIPETCDAGSLGYQAPSTKQQAIENTLSKWTEPHQSSVSTTLI